MNGLSFEEEKAGIPKSSTDKFLQLLDDNDPLEITALALVVLIIAYIIYTGFAEKILAALEQQAEYRK